mgnify:CR=1 FL=1
MPFDIKFALKLLPLMLKYLSVTLYMAIIAIAVGLVLAFFIALIIHAKLPVVQRFFKIYISFFRGTPLIAQLFCVYFGVLPLLPSFALNVTSTQAAIIVMSLNTSAYMAEALRGALSSIDKGQMEASLSVGMTYMQAMRRIILPQAFRVAVPALGNSFINTVKDTALTYSIGVKEIMAVAQLEATARYRYLEAFIDILIFYWLITSILGAEQKRLEKRLNRMVGENT